MTFENKTREVFRIFLIKKSFDKKEADFYYATLMAFILKHQKITNTLRFHLYKLLPKVEAYFVAYFTNNFKEAQVIERYGHYDSLNRTRYFFSWPCSNLESELPDNVQNFLDNAADGMKVGCRGHFLQFDKYKTFALLFNKHSTSKGKYKTFLELLGYNLDKNTLSQVNLLLN